MVPPANVASKVVVTGVSPHGIGETACLAIAAHGPRLIIFTGRDLERTRTAKSAIVAQYPDMDIRIVHMDLASNESVKQAAEEINKICAADTGCIDVLVNNAGVMCLPHRTLTNEDLEMHLQVNYIGHYLLTRLLLDKLASSPGGGRVVNVSSSAHAISPFRFSDPTFVGAEKVEPDEQPSKEGCKDFDVPWTLGYSPLIAYGQSKTAVVLHAVALTQSVGKGIAACSVHPGVIETDLWRHMACEIVAEILASLPVKTRAQGAATILVAAFDPALQEHPGAYLDDCALATPANYASDINTALKLWDWTEQKCLSYIRPA